MKVNLSQGLIVPPNNRGKYLVYRNGNIDLNISQFIRVVFRHGPVNYLVEERDSNRSNKELLRGNTKGTTIHKYQCQIAWILHDIKCGPICFIEDNIIEANNIISHLRSIANV